MKLACNLSNELMKLIEDEVVNVDFVKIALPSIEDNIPEEYCRYGKLLIHGVGKEVPQHTGARNLDNIEWDKVNKKIDFCHGEFYGIHCGTYKKDWDEESVSYEMVKARMSRNIIKWRDNINKDLLIENVPYTEYYHENSPGIIKYAVLPQMIRELCNENGVGLLLDIAHAKVAASGLQMSIDEYIEGLPLDKVKEIHAVGTRSTEVGLRDNHLEMTEEDYEILRFVLERSNPEIVTLEYGGFGEHFSWRTGKDEIKRQCDKITGLIGEWNE